jgi:LPXTG-motif cell wall-anchored protein
MNNLPQKIPPVVIIGANPPPEKSALGLLIGIMLVAGIFIVGGKKKSRDRR